MDFDPHPPPRLDQVDHAPGLDKTLKVSLDEDMPGRNRFQACLQPTPVGFADEEDPSTGEMIMDVVSSLQQDRQALEGLLGHKLFGVLVDQLDVHIV